MHSKGSATLVIILIAIAVLATSAEIWHYESRRQNNEAVAQNQHSSSSTPVASGPLHITSPADGTTVYQGQTISVTFSADPAVSNIALQTGVIGGWAGQTSGHHTFSLTIPSTTPIEQYQVYVVGTDGGTVVTSDPISINVDTPLSIGAIHTDPGTLQFDKVGDVLSLLVVGRLSDGTQTFVTYSPRISFSSDNPKIATVDNRGEVTAVAPGSTHIIISGGTSPYNVYVSVPAERH